METLSPIPSHSLLIHSSFRKSPDFLPDSWPKGSQIYLLLLATLVLIPFKQSTRGLTNSTLVPNSIQDYYKSCQWSEKWKDSPYLISLFSVPSPTGLVRFVPSPSSPQDFSVIVNGTVSVKQFGSQKPNLAEGKSKGSGQLLMCTYPKLVVSQLSPAASTAICTYPKLVVSQLSPAASSLFSQGSSISYL